MAKFDRIENKSPLDKKSLNKKAFSPLSSKSLAMKKQLGGLNYTAGTEILKPSPATVQTKKDTEHKLTDLNSMRPQSNSAKAPVPDLKNLEKLGYIIYPVASLDVLNSDPQVKNHDASLRQQKIGHGGYDAVTSGTFYSDGHPVGAVMRDKTMDTSGVEKAKNRGSMAVLEDGSVVVKRMDGNRKEDIQKTFGTQESKVKDFLGGGALLIEDGNKVASEDLAQKQRFDQGGQGIRSAQMRDTDHILVGIRDGQCFVIIAKSKTGAQIQTDLLKSGFDSVIKYDGGSGGYAKDSHGVRTGGTNPTGLGIHVRN
jgi:hypothetical protein